MVAKHYQALRTIGTIYKVLGVIAGVLTILLVLGFCGFSVLGGSLMSSLRNSYGYGGGPSFGGAFGGLVGGLIGSIVLIIYGGAISVTLYAFGEGVYLLLALEENTRATAQLLQQQLGSKSSPPTA